MNDALKSYVEDHVWLEEQVARSRQEIAAGQGIGGGMSEICHANTALHSG
jgi:hypothetical protein